MQVKLKVAGNDLTLSMVEESLLINNVINKRIDLCRLVVHDTSGSIDISNWDEIIISNTGETVRYFAGYITNVAVDGVGGIKKAFTCWAQDYTVLTDRAIVNEAFEDKTTAFILNALFVKYLNEIDAATYVATGKTYDKLLLNRVTLREVIDRLAKDAGFDWYIDYNKNLHFFSAETNIAPFGISDNPNGSTTYAAEKLQYKKESTTIANRVMVVGGEYLSDNATFYLPGNGVTTELLMPYKLHGPAGETSILVWHNDGSDGAPNWQPDTIGVDYINALGIDGITVLHNYQEKLLKFDTAPPSLNLAIKITARYDVPVLMRVRSELSFSTYGRWLDAKIVNKDLTSKGAAKLAGKALLAERAFEHEVGNFEVTGRDGLVAGQRIPITNALRGIDGNYMITQVTTTILGGTTCLYKVYFGEYNPDLIDILVALKATSDAHEDTRADAVLNELFERYATLALSDVPALITPLTGAYKWDAFKWNFATWG